jgi:hypothetical protein
LTVKFLNSSLPWNAFVFTAPSAKILLLVFAGKIRGFYLTQDRPPNLLTPINPGGQTEILFD